MAVAFDAKGTADLVTGAAATSASFTNLTVGSGANRALVVLAIWDTKTVSAITAVWDNGGSNQSCGSLVSRTCAGGTFGHGVLFGLVAPTSGNKTLLISWTGAAQCTVDVVSFTGVDQTGGVTSFPHATSADAASTSPALTVTSAIGNMVVGLMGSDQAVTSISPATQIFLDNTPTNFGGAGNYVAGAAAPVSLSAAMGGTSDWLFLGTDIAAAVDLMAQACM